MTILNFEDFKRFTVEQFVMKHVSEDSHIRVSSFTIPTYAYDSNVVYDGDAAPIYRGKIGRDILDLKVLGVDAVGGVLHITAE